MTTSEPITGAYYDPNHGGCLRYITALQGGLWQVTGFYGEKEQAQNGVQWQAHLRFVPGSKRHMIVDFYNKRTTHDRIYEALWCPTVREIHWEDGNVWKKMYSPL